MVRTTSEVHQITIAHRYAYRERALHARAHRRVVRKHNNTSKRPKTYAEKKAIREKNRDAKYKLNTAIETFRGQMWEMAKKLREQFGNIRTTQWFHDQIMYGYTRKGGEREVNPWNAFIHLRKKEAETGMSSFFD